jgi:F0F1-type ATP synthase assembly protein I
MTEKKSASVKQDEKSVMVFSKKNYQLLLISIAIVVVGFLLMIGTTGDIYDTRRTLIAPMVVLFGFGFGIYAILKK